MGEVIGAGELHKGVKLLIDGEPWEIARDHARGRS